MGLREKLMKNRDDVTPRDDEDVKQSFMEQVRAHMNRNKHRSMERTVRSLAIATSIFFVGVGVSVYHHSSQVALSSVTTSPINVEAVFSKTGTSMIIGQPVLANDGRTAYVPLTAKNMKNLPTNPDDYRIYVDTMSGNDLTYNPSVQLMYFGDTGYGALVLNGEPFIKNQMLQIILRNDKLLVASDANVKVTEGSLKDAAKVLDLAVFNVNPNAKNVRYTDALGGSDLSPSDIYRVLFADKKVYDIQQDVLAKQASIELSLKRVEEYKTRLLRNGFILPDDPPYVAQNWLPSNAVPVNVLGNLSEGLATSKEALNTATGSTETTVSTPNITDSQDVNVQTDSDEVIFDAFLRNVDGTISTDDVHNSGGSSAQSVWTDLQELYTSILETKQNIYVEDAFSLLKIERDMLRFDAVSLISDGTNVDIWQNVDLKEDTPDGVPHTPTKIEDYK